jgi:hypothetical protein
MSSKKSKDELQDIKYDWVKPNILKLTIYWPDWFTFAEQMAMFVVDNKSGEPMCPPEHALTGSFGENNADRVDETNRISYVG